MSPRSNPCRVALTVALLACVPEAASAIPSSPSWTVEGEQEFAGLGSVVSTAGDVNGDGYSDVIVTVGFFNGETGWAFVYHGSASGLATTPAWTGHTSPTGSYFTAGAAGDVNGDGFSDVILGAPEYSNGQSFEGRALLYLGSASGLSTTPAWTVESNQSSAEFGSSVGTAGDVNGDGYADVIVGARFYEDLVATVNEGSAFIYHGSASGLATSPATTLQSDVQAAFFGSSVGTAGDMNGDGYADVIVGAPNYPNGGAAYVYLGSSGGAGTNPVFLSVGGQAGASWGNAVGTAGDVNGDGYSDIIVGAYQYDNGQVNEGRATVFHGSSTGVATPAAWTAEINQGAFGTSVGTAGDVNGDGYADVIVGAPNYNNGQAAEGFAAVYMGSGSGLSTTAIWSSEGNQIAADMGRSVATAGDVNGDGRSDVIVGVPGYDGGLEDEGSAKVFHGTSSGPASFLPTVGPGQPGSRLGSSVAGAGDVNGDGYSDVIVGSLGSANVYLGTPSGISSTIAWTEFGDGTVTGFGKSVASAGDVNGDGFSDVIIGATERLIDQDRGAAFLYLGASAGLMHIPVWVGRGSQSDSHYGISVATAGDVNGDGRSDVIVAEYHEKLPGQMSPWRAYVYHGTWQGLTATPAWSTGDSVPAVNQTYQVQVASAGDVNGDGFSDVIIGMDGLGANAVTSAAGQARVFHGSAAGLGAVPAWTVEGQTDLDHLGRSAATAGDVNGDGFSDVIIGSGSGAANEAQVFCGSASGLASTPAWVIDNGGTGHSVATAGDLDVDGFSDVIVGEPWYANGQSNEGRVVAYRGSASGLGTTPAWSVEGNQVDAQLGFQVASAGDGNTDGFSEVIAGLPGSSSGAGRAWVGAETAGIHRKPQQLRAAISTPVSLLGTPDSHTSIRLSALGRTPAGRDRVRLQLEMKPLDTPFDATGLVTGTVTNTGTPAGVSLIQLVTGLGPDEVYHWRLRVLGDSPYFPRSIWVGPAGNGSSEADFRVPSTTTAVEEISSPSRRHVAAAPNPFTSVTQLTYDLARTGPLRLSLYDVGGRRVSVLAEGVQAAGHHAVPWDGTDGNGIDLPGGVYFLRFESEDHAETRKIVIAR